MTTLTLLTAAERDELVEALRDSRQFARPVCPDPDCRVCRDRRAYFERRDALLAKHAPKVTP